MNVQTPELTKMASPSTLMYGDARQFRDNFNRYSFEFAHRLAGHPLFQIPRLLELSKNLPRRDVVYDAGQVRVEQRWDEVPPTQLSVQQLIDRIENAGAWILLKRSNQIPEYAAVLDQLLAEAADMVGPQFPKKVRMRSAVILITSPNRTTSYHMDPDCNFLCHIQGTKTLYVFDRYDREVLPEEEIERFWAVETNAAVYKKQYQDRAKTYALKPGVGVHIPVNCPHWVQNDDNVSVTLAAEFQFLETHLGNIYRMNYFLRKAGIVPLPPGRSKVRDALKSWTIGSANGARRVLKRVLRKSS